jgi:hypothetical protein
MREMTTVWWVLSSNTMIFFKVIPNMRPRYNKLTITKKKPLMPKGDIEIMKKAFNSQKPGFILQGLSFLGILVTILIV